MVDGKFGIDFALSGKTSFRLLLLLKIQAIALLAVARNLLDVLDDATISLKTGLNIL